MLNYWQYEKLFFETEVLVENVGIFDVKMD